MRMRILSNEALGGGGAGSWLVTHVRLDARKMGDLGTKKRALGVLTALVVAAVLLLAAADYFRLLSGEVSPGGHMQQQAPPFQWFSVSNISDEDEAIATVYPLPHYGKDLCLQFNNKHHQKKTKRIYRHPNIVHYVKMASNKGTDAELKLLDYVSILSVDKNYKPDKIVIHSNRKLTGELWKLANTLNTTIEERYAARRPTIGRSNKPAKTISHEADVHKIEIAMKEGGIVMDFDVIILDGENLRRQQASSECVLSIERECTFVNAGFISCVPNTVFLGKWWQGYMNDYRNTWSSYLYNCGEYSARILRGCPSCYNVYLDPEICMNPDAGAPGGPGPGRDPWKVKNGVKWRNKTVVHVLLHHLQVPKTNYLLNLWDCSYKELVMHILGDSYKQFLPKPNS